MYGFTNPGNKRDKFLVQGIPLSFDGHPEVDGHPGGHCIREEHALYQSLEDGAGQDEHQWPHGSQFDAISNRLARLTREGAIHFI
eukprot:CAMPEP_0179211402 /NCGR_PEP_ID=MMETSP0797-20121207/442_1 /TAXON_ID=47934 /ORGANISM="Dinophysis acuminata, Strain DAEP01" /LENGTH=84 /DNA_ID=CAMNT_0020916723 /DNA_START=560 /DNA_END=814 /DNA_ORIENTATION=+